MNTIEDLQEWMQSDLSRFGKLEDTVEVIQLDQTNCVNADPFEFAFNIYTDANKYRIVARPGFVQSEAAVMLPRKSYLGCTSSSRKPRAGETWSRGRDLADGELTRETWLQILADIVSYELVRIHNKQDVQAA